MDSQGVFLVQSFLSREDNGDEVEDDGNTESRAKDEKEKRVIELMKYVEECKSKPKSWIDKYPAKVQLLEPINGDSKSIKHAKNGIVNNLTGKHPHEIFEQYVNAKLKLITYNEKECYGEKNIMHEPMSRKKFEGLKSFTHFADNNILDTNDRFTKVRSFYDVMNKNLRQFFFFMLFISFMNE